GIFSDVREYKADIAMFDECVLIYIIAALCSSLHGKDDHKNAFTSLKLSLGADPLTSISDINL
ncbi:cysteine hydrolase, partial [Francisella tularensis]|nr:cysteine hydrolase [Francisella tularensis]